MKRIIIFYILALVIVNAVQAKKANAIWYFLAKTSTSVSENNDISVQYRIYTKFANEKYSLAPYPTMRIKVTNKSDEIIFVDLGTSFIKKNNVASVIYTPTITSTMVGQSVGVGVNMGSVANAVGIGGMVGETLDGVNIGGNKGSSVTTTTYAQRYVSIPPKSQVVLEDIQIFTPGSEKALRNMFYFKEIGIGKQRRLWCLSYKFKDVKSGQIYEYTERNPLFTIGCYLNYSFSADFKTTHSIETTYYVQKMVGSSFSTLFSNKNFRIMDKTFPQWRSEVNKGNLEYIRLWAK